MPPPPDPANASPPRSDHERQPSMSIARRPRTRPKQSKRFKQAAGRLTGRGVCAPKAALTRPRASSSRPGPGPSTPDPTLTPPARWQPLTPAARPRPGPPAPSVCSAWLNVERIRGVRTSTGFVDRPHRDHRAGRLFMRRHGNEPPASATMRSRRPAVLVAGLRRPAASSAWARRLLQLGPGKRSAWRPGGR